MVIMRRSAELAALVCLVHCGCAGRPCAPVGLPASPRLLALDSPSALPRLDKDAMPAVRIYLRNGTQERIDALVQRMSLHGYSTDVRAGTDEAGAVTLSFMAEPTEIIQLYTDEMCWAAAKRMIQAHIPFTLGIAKYVGMFVPGPLAAKARDILGRDPLLDPHVVEADGRLRRDAR